VTVCPGFKTSSVGLTCTSTGAPSPFSTCGGTATPVVALAAFGPMA
jgi:hypothetical protein